MARFQAAPLLLAAIMSAACTTIGAQDQVATLSMADRHAKDPPCESSTVWMGHCMTPPSERESNELHWRDPVAAYAPDALCSGECMVAPSQETVYQDEAISITPFGPPSLLERLRDRLFGREDPQ